MVFTRSCTSEYAGIRYTGRATTDTTLQASTLLKVGEMNYLNPASGKNRWGDYSGAAVDPADPSKLWFFGEYAASPVNTWGTWAGLVAISGAPLLTSTPIATPTPTPTPTPTARRLPRIVPFR